MKQDFFSLINTEFKKGDNENTKGILKRLTEMQIIIKGTRNYKEEPRKIREFIC